MPMPRRNRQLPTVQLDLFRSSSPQSLDRPQPAVGCSYQNIEGELVFADFDQAERRLERLKKERGQVEFERIALEKCLRWLEGSEFHPYSRPRPFHARDVGDLPPRHTRKKRNVMDRSWRAKIPRRDPLAARRDFSMSLKVLKFHRLTRWPGIWAPDCVAEKIVRRDPALCPAESNRDCSPRAIAISRFSGALQLAQTRTNAAIFGRLDEKRPES
jgi:hypothetical protein